MVSNLVDHCMHITNDVQPMLGRVHVQEDESEWKRSTALRCKTNDDKRVKKTKKKNFLIHGVLAK